MTAFDPEFINSDLSALAPLRDEGTLAICSGHATHNIRANRDPAAPVPEWTQSFQDSLDSVCTSTLSSAERAADYQRSGVRARGAKLAHPNPDHLSPFVTAAGAGIDERQPRGEKVGGGWDVAQFSFASYAWGGDCQVDKWRAGLRPNTALMSLFPY
ncbi:hypothetical protein Gpo141_00014918 [Globisporangium polare]